MLAIPGSPLDALWRLNPRAHDNFKTSLTATRSWKGSRRRCKACSIPRRAAMT